MPQLISCLFSFDKMLNLRGVISSFVSSFFIVALFFYYLSYLKLQSTTNVEKVIIVAHHNNGQKVKVANKSGHTNDQKVVLYYNTIRPTQKGANHGNQNNTGPSYWLTNCPLVNCIITTDKSYLEDISHFDAIVFNRFYYPIKPPKQRSLHQIYIMMTRE